MAIFTKDFWKGMDDGAAEARRAQRAEEEALAAESARRKEAQDFLFRQAQENRIADSYSQNWAGNQLISDKAIDSRNTFNDPRSVALRSDTLDNAFLLGGAQAQVDNQVALGLGTPEAIAQRSNFAILSNITGTRQKTAALGDANLSLDIAQSNPAAFSQDARNKAAIVGAGDPSQIPHLAAIYGINTTGKSAAEVLAELINPMDTANAVIAREAGNYKTDQKLAEIRLQGENALAAKLAGKPVPLAKGAPMVNSPLSNMQKPAVPTTTVPAMTAKVVPTQAAPAVVPVPPKATDPSVLSQQIEQQKTILALVKTPQEYQIAKYKLDLLRSQLAQVLRPPALTRTEEADQRARFISGKE